MLPGGIIPRFIVKSQHDLTKNPTYWRSGVVLAIEDCRAFVRGDIQKAHVFISIIGPEPRRRGALSVIRNRFREIHVTIPKLAAKQKVPLPQDPAVLFDYEELLAYERDGHPTIPARLSNGQTMQVDIAALLDGYTTRETRMSEQKQPTQRRHPEGLPQPPEAPPFVAEPTTTTTAAAPTWERVAIFAAGIAFVLMLVAIALFVPDPTAFQRFIFRSVLALAAGAVGALIPGLIDVQFKNWLRAGGAIALFVLVYLINPPELIVESVDAAPTAVTEP